MRILLFLITLFFASYNSCAQAGYLGKRMYSVYDFGFAPALINPTYNRAKKTLRFNTAHNFSTGYIISNVRAIEFGFGYSRTSIKYDFGNEGVYAGQYKYDVEIIDDIGYDPLLPELKVVSYRYDIRWIAYANQGARLAPLGVYSAYGISILDSYIGDKFEDEVFYFDNFKSLLISYSLGNRRIIFDAIMINYSIGSTLNLSIVAEDLSDNEIIISAQRRILSGGFLMAKIGIGLVY